MARNRKTDAASVRFGPLLKVILLGGFICFSGVGYVWQQNQVAALGRQIKQRENRLADLLRQNKMRRDHYSTLTSPVALEERVKRLNLGMGRPVMTQIVRLVEPPLPLLGGGMTGETRTLKMP